MNHLTFASKITVRGASMFALAALAALVACSGGGGGSSPPRPTSTPSASPSTTPVVPQQMTVPLSFGNSSMNPGPRIAVALPSASPATVLLDTGSTGLRLLPSAMQGVPASAYTDTKTPTALDFGSGNVYFGTVGIANPGTYLGGSLEIVKSFNFQIVKIVCDGVSAPIPMTPPANCTPGSANDNTMAAENEVGGGIMGVLPSSATMSLSPLAELPAPLSYGFMISAHGSSPTLTAGATVSNQSGFEVYPVPVATATDGSPYWAGNSARFPWCYQITVGTAAPVSSCPNPSTGILTDSGGDNESLNLSTAPPGMLAPNTPQTLPTGSMIVATLTSSGATMPSISWTLTTGNCKYYNAPTVYFSEPSASPSPSGSAPSTTNGLTAFLNNDILYDLHAGGFGFRPVVPAMPLPYCS